jgi:hypothetical protein
MKIIEKMIEDIEEELEGAKNYAEKYLENKARGNMQRASTFKEMSMDELRHAAHVYDFSMQDISHIKDIYTLPVNIEERWDHARKHYAECVGWIKQMLA